MVTFIVQLILFMIILNIVNGQPAPNPDDCLVDGIVRRNGKKFTIKCSGRCTCNEGHYGCVSMCPPFQVPPPCRQVKKTGECCLTAICPNSDTEKEKCQPIVQKENSALINDTFEPQWSVLLQVKNGGKTGVCLASVLDNNRLLANPNCIGPDTTISYPASGSHSRVRAQTDAQNTQHVATVQLDPALEFLPSLHEINKPYEKACKKQDCALFIAAYDPNAEKMRLMVGEPVGAELCNMNPVDIANHLSCLKVRTSSPMCLNFDGAGVAIKDNDLFYLVGQLTDGPFFAVDNNKCDLNQSVYKKFRRLCDASHTVA